MAVDTAQKRASCIGIGMPFRISLPVASGSIDVGVREHLVGLYAGIAATPITVLHITEIVGGWYIPGASVGEAFTPGVSRITNHQLTGQGYAAGSTIGEGRQ